MTFESYTKYKASGVVWLGEVPESWRPIRFKNVLVEKAKTPNPSLDAGSISFGTVIFKKSESISPETRESYQEVLAGEFLINPLNLNFDIVSLRTALSKINVAVSTGYIVLQSNGRLVKNYARWLLQQFDVSHMKTLGAGVRQTISYSDIGNSFFYEPSAAEQVAIAAFLDVQTAKIDTLIARQETMIDLLKEKRRAVISHAVTKGLDPDVPMRASGVEWLGNVPAHWPLTKAKYVSDIFVPQRNKPELNETDGYPWVTMENMREAAISESQHRVSDKALSEAGSKILVAGSVIASCVGSFGVASINPGPVVINQQLQAYVPKTINAHFLRYLISISTAYFEMIGTAATLVYVNQTGFANLPVPVPPVDEQIEIHSYLEEACEKINCLIGKAMRAIDLQKEHRTALISAAVTGKIDVRNEVAKRKAA